MEIGSDDLRAPYDLIVVGTGPAGLTLAHSYEERTGNKTLLIESGPRSRADGAVPQVHSVAATGDLSADYYAGHSQRAFGGTSTIWTGYCAVLEKRAFLNNEWPLKYEDLYAYYPRAAEILALPEAVYSRPEVAFPGNSNIVYRPYFLSPPIRFNEAFEDWTDTSANLDVLFNHTVVDMDTSHGTVTGVYIRGPTATQASRIDVLDGNVVLATGGIQNARLLHLTMDEPNIHLGRYFSEHPHLYGVATAILDAGEFDSVKHRETEDRIVHAIALSSEFSARNSLYSATFSIKESDRSPRNLLGQSKASIIGEVTIRAEMVPDQNNRVSLAAADNDSPGEPIAEVSMRFDRAPWRVAEALNSELIRSGLGRMSSLANRLSVTGGGHMLGTTRMGYSADHSVVDPQGRVHGMNNLYVAGSSLFPAGGAANPTLSIVALALRLADHLAGSK